MYAYILIIAMLLAPAAHAANWTEWKTGTTATSSKCTSISDNQRCFWFYDTITAGNESPVISLKAGGRCAIKFRGATGTIHPYYCDAEETFAQCERVRMYNNEAVPPAVENVALTETLREAEYYGPRTLMIDPAAGASVYAVVECGGQ